MSRGTSSKSTEKAKAPKTKELKQAETYMDLPTEEGILEQVPETKESKAYEEAKEKAIKKAKEEKPDKEDTVTQVQKFLAEAERARIAGDDSIEVTKEVFDYYMQGKETPYFTWGNPALKVYKKGEREMHEAFDRLSPEERTRKMAGQ